jgi:hypothetical protein
LKLLKYNHYSLFFTMALQLYVLFSSIWNSYKKTIIDSTIFITSACWTYMVCVLLHFIAVHAYIKYCVGDKWYHLFHSMFYVSSPYCQGISWAIYYGSRKIQTMWFILGTFLSNRLFSYIFSPYKPFSQSDVPKCTTPTSPSK